LIKGQAERIWRIVSDDKERMVELERLKIILARNEYPSDVVDNTIRRFLEKKARVTETAKGPEKEIKRFLKLPYVGRKCEDFAFRLKRVVTDFLPQVEFNVAFQAPMTIGKLFPFKDGVKDKLDRSMVVYSLKCSCGAEYVGKTIRDLGHRVHEHKTTKASSVHEHLTCNPGHAVAFDKVEIVDTAENDTRLRIKELLHIHSRNPTLNKQHGPQSNYEIRTLIIKAYAQFTAA